MIDKSHSDEIKNPTTNEINLTTAFLDKSTKILILMVILDLSHIITRATRLISEIIIL